MKISRVKRMNVVILGAGDSGKSTFLKQLSFKYATDFTGNTHLINNLRENILFSAKELVELAETKKVEVPDKDSIMKCETLTPEVATNIANLLQNEAFMDLFNRDGDSLGLQGGISGTEYLFKHALRITDPDYKPTDEDICWARSKTTGIEKVEIDLNEGLKIQVHDIGGQRSERKKWPKIFNHIGYVIYLCALNEYDMVLEEENKKNRLHESLKIWEKLTKSTHFHQACFVLLFNKCDIFEKKIQIKPLNTVFKNYDEFANSRPAQESNFEKGWRYIEDLFKKRFHGTVPFDTFVTNSTSKESFNLTWEKITAKLEKLANEDKQKGELKKSS